MTILTGVNEVLNAANDPDLAESGGGHGTKGVDFQRWWSVLRMIELEESGIDDFLILYESVQDVTELDSAKSPTSAHIYQVKKKDRKEWSLNNLSGTSLSKSSKSKVKKPIESNIRKSPLGKLHLSLNSFPSLEVKGTFISNAGFDLKLANGGNAATSSSCSLAELDSQHVAQLTVALKLLSSDKQSSPDLQKLNLKKVHIHPDDPASPVIHATLKFLNNRSPRHAGQASSFAESLITKISPLGRRTDQCKTFEKLVKERGFTKNEFLQALSALESTPDYLQNLEDWLRQLQTEGMDFMQVTGIRSHAARLFREKLQASAPPITLEVNKFCDLLIKKSHLNNKLFPYFTDALIELKKNFSDLRDEELMARFALRAIKSCVDQT